MFCRACLTFFLLAGLAGPSQQTPDDEIYTLEGTVVNSATGEPIPGALVREADRAMRTLADGRFRFPGIAAGTTNLIVMKPGYFDPENQYRPQASSTVTVGPNTSPLLIKLAPEGIIYGRISGEDGEPIESLQVQILEQRILYGEQTRSQVKSAMTDDDGQFRMAGLSPGRYFLVAGPENAAQCQLCRLTYRFPRQCRQPA